VKEEGEFLMRKMSVLLVLAALAIFAAACASSEPAEEPTVAPEPTEEPTAVPLPTEAPTEEPTAEPTEAPTVIDSEIVDPTWHWLAFQDQADENNIGVPDPENYTLTLMPDGTASIKADCNMVSWTYTLEGSSLTFNTLGPSTLAFCGEESFDQQYLALLGNTATYVMDGDNLVLNLTADAGNMVFGPEGAEPIPGDEPSGETAVDIVGGTWLWQAFKDQAGVNDIMVPDPENYTLTLMPDGTASIKADCNMVSWTYTLEGSSLTFNTLGPSTLAFCGEESLDQQYLGLLGNTATYVINEGDLVLNLAADAGNMIFSAAETAAEAAGDQQPAEVQLTDVTWLWQGFQDQADVNNVITPNPEDYSLTLLPDGTASIKADCNMVSWTYTLEGSSLTFNTLGPSTLAFCGEESLDQQYLALLGDTATYVTDDGRLILNLVADAGNMIFETPTLTGTVWQWENIVTPVEAYDNPTPELYTVRFNEDGTVNIKADCNMASGSFTADDSGFAMEVGPATLAECGPESLSNEFIQALGGAAIPFFLDGKLYMDLIYDSGTLRFGAAGGAAITGAVTYRQRIALPEDAMVDVQLRDTSLADAPSETIGVQVIQTNGRQVPIPFVVRYNPAAIIENHTYTMSARITDGEGNLLFINDTAIPVITNDNPTSEVEIVVVPVG
jgi:heat shock protein HslJ